MALWELQAVNLLWFEYVRHAHYIFFQPTVVLREGIFPSEN